jgi:Leucine-rich repeat (LRR) protein
MPREEKLTFTSGGVRREYRVVYQDDSPERAEAVAFFREHAECLFPAMRIPDEVSGMPIREANEYLRRHPIEEQWSLLRIGRQNPISDDDLARLRHLPELDHVQISSDRITDAGVEHLVYLPSMTHLGIFSAGITDACLRVIRTLRSLRSLDLQASPNLSRAAVLAAVDAMPWLQDAWPPPDPARLARCRQRHELSRQAEEQPDARTEAEVANPNGSLRYVNLSRQPMIRLPADLFATDDIWRLDLISCGVEVLPDDIGNLTQLRTLYANWCRLTELPETLGRLTALEDLWLNNNQLTRLPDAFARLLRLKKLSLDANRLGRFPEAVLRLTRLEELRLTDNGIAVLPDEIGGLTELRSLSLGRNDLTTLPRGIAGLKKLTYLGLQGNPLRSLPDELWRLSRRPTVFTTR